MLVLPAVDRMWSDGSLEPPMKRPVRTMWMASLTDGLFDIDGLDYEPTDPLDLDLDLLPTLNSPRKSTESNDSTTDLTMLENWQMNEVFQDIPDTLESTDSLQTPQAEDHCDELDMLLKHAFSDPLPSPTGVPEGVEYATQHIQDNDVLLGDIDLIPAELDLTEVIKETFGDHGLDGYQLLEELEAMEESPSPPESPEQTPSSPEEIFKDAKLAMESDHQYSQLSVIDVKPNETKKQAIRRVKNNVASRVCRKQRKNRFVVNTSKIEELVKANADLRRNIDNVQSVVDMLKEHLVQATRQ